MKKTIQILILFLALGLNSVAQTVDLQRGLVAYYPFNGNANDESGNNGNNGTVYGATLTADRNGISNRAYSFDGINDYIDLNNINPVRGKTITVSVDVYFSSKPNNLKSPSIIRKRDKEWTLDLYDYKLRFGVGNKTAKYSLSNVKLDEWMQVTGRLSNNKLELFINGKRVASEYCSNSITTNSDYLRIGCNGEYPQFFRGKIDNIRIYNRALNDAEIQALYNFQEKVVEKPVITFNNPNSSFSTVNQSFFILKACIKSGEPLKNLSVYVNGKNMSGFNVVPSSDCNFNLNKTIYLRRGNNPIKIVAENSGGSTTTPIYSITYEKFATDNTPPQIVITNPNVSRGFKPVEQQNKVTITGKATDASGIFEILVNGEPANVDEQGNFSKTVLLAFGDNSFTVKATDIKQNSATETFVIERKSNQQVVVNNQTNNSKNLQTGKYYALIIGNNDYQDPAINSLDGPINDATKLYDVLTTEYTFEPQNVTFLKNASYVQMIDAFDKLSNKITENDNLLVFYAGHGWWDDKKELGYWLPTNAKQSSTAFWIRNSTISDYMSSIDTKHTLLIADACFSGSIFKTRSAFADAGQAINSLYKLPSRTAMTSGNLKEVPDKSVFLEYLVKRLDKNTVKYLSADQLFVSFRIAVMNNSQTAPQFGTIQNAGDEGGEFIFIRK